MNRMIRNIIYALFLLVGGYACRPAPTEADREKLYAQLRRADSCARSKQEEQAIQLYFEWLERSEGKVNTLTRADVYDKIGKLYLYRNLYVDALDMFRRSAGIYRDMGAWKEEAGAWRNIGRTHLMRQRGDSIIQSYQRAIQLAEETGEQELLKGIQQEFQFVCSKTALLKGNARLWLHFLDKLNSMDAGCLLLGSVMAQQPDRHGGAERWLLRAADSEDLYIRAQAHRELYDWAKRTGNAEKTAHYSDLYIQSADSLEKEYSTSLSFHDLGQSYEKQRMEMEHERMKNRQLRRTNMLLGIIIGLGLLLLASFQIYRKEKRRKEGELARLMKQIREKEQQIEDLQNARPETDTEPEDGPSRYAAFDLLYRMKTAPRYGLIGTEEEWLQVYAVINRLYGDIVGKLEGYPQLTELDVRICYLVHARMSNADLGVLFNVDGRSVSKSKQRIKKKMEIAADCTLEDYLTK